MAYKSRYTPEMRADMKRRREAGESLVAIAKTYKTASATVYYILNPEKDAARKKQNRERARPHDRRPNTRYAQAARAGPTPPTPPDTRTIGAKLAGDPLPGRSALDMKRNTLDENYPPSGPLYIRKAPTVEDETGGSGRSPGVDPGHRTPEPADCELDR